LSTVHEAYDLFQIWVQFYLRDPIYKQFPDIVDPIISGDQKKLFHEIHGGVYNCVISSIKIREDLEFCLVKFLKPYEKEKIDDLYTIFNNIIELSPWSKHYGHVGPEYDKIFEFYTTVNHKLNFDMEYVHQFNDEEEYDEEVSSKFGQQIQPICSVSS